MAKKYNHPITGESISFGKNLSWKIQFAIRRWVFIGAITTITIVCWALGIHNAIVLLWWNLVASWGALFIESVVGISMFEQTTSDAKIIRKNLAKIEEVLIKINAILDLETQQNKEVHNLVDALEDEINLHH
jgi:hypothetical protein